MTFPMLVMCLRVKGQYLRRLVIEECCSNNYLNALRLRYFVAVHFSALCVSSRDSFTFF